MGKVIDVEKNNRDPRDRHRGDGDGWVWISGMIPEVEAVIERRICPVRREGALVVFQDAIVFFASELSRAERVDKSGFTIGPIGGGSLAVEFGGNISPVDHVGRSLDSVGGVDFRGECDGGLVGGIPSNGNEGDLALGNRSDGAPSNIANGSDVDICDFETLSMNDPGDEFVDRCSLDIGVSGLKEEGLGDSGSDGADVVWVSASEDF